MQAAPVWGGESCFKLSFSRCRGDEVLSLASFNISALLIVYLLRCCHDCDDRHGKRRESHQRRQSNRFQGLCSFLHLYAHLLPPFKIVDGYVLYLGQARRA
jgi:hypothetical protein